MSTPKLALDDEHRYWLGKQRIPGVSEILDSLGLIPSFAKSEAAALRGTIVHRACHLLVLGKLDWSTVDPRILGRVLAYERFLKETGFEPELLEHMTWHKDFLYAGTLDALGRTLKFKKFLFDIKTGGPLKYHALQTAAYAGFFPGLLPRATLFLQEDERYHLKFHNDRSDWGAWVSCVNVYRLKEAA